MKLSGLLCVNLDLGLWMLIRTILNSWMGSRDVETTLRLLYLLIKCSKETSIVVSFKLYYIEVLLIIAYFEVILNMCL